jgi:hypothetical protein
VVQIDPAPAYDQILANRVVLYLQTRDSRLFPFTEAFDDDQLRAFVQDLRVGLAEITDSGGKRGTSASGFITSDRRLHDIVSEWAAAGGGWPEGTDPTDEDTALASLRPV